MFANIAPSVRRYVCTYLLRYQRTDCEPLSARVAGVAERKLKFPIRDVGVPSVA